MKLLTRPGHTDPLLHDFHCKRETISRVWVFNSQFHTFWGQKDNLCMTCFVFTHTPLVVAIKPGFHYPNWQPELTGDRFPLPVNTGRVDGRISTSRVEGPSIRPVNSGSGNRTLVYSKHLCTDPGSTITSTQEHRVWSRRTSGHIALRVSDKISRYTQGRRLTQGRLKMAVKPLNGVGVYWAIPVMCKILLKSILKIQNKIVFSKYFSK